MAAPAVAQTDPPALPSRPITLPAAVFPAEPPAQQLRDLLRWTHDYAEWRAWFEQWRSRPEPGLFSTRDRRPPPVPPQWLPDACAPPVGNEGLLADACRAWREWDADEATQVFTQQLAQAQTHLETPTKTLWWEHIHVDGLWPMTRTGSNAIGIAGMHTTMNLTKRLQVFLAPGAILVRLPSITGDMTWSAATDWGFSYRLFDFRFPGTARLSALNVNIVRVWLLGRDAVQSPGEVYLAGFSVTFKRQ